MIRAQCVPATALRRFVSAEWTLRNVRANAAETEGFRVKRSDAAKPDRIKTPAEAIEAPFG
jgi:hypothetical protein